MSVGLSSPHGDWTFLNERRQEVAVSVELAPTAQKAGGG